MRMKPMFNIFYTVCITISCPRWIIINMCPIESRTSVFCFFLYFFFFFISSFFFSTTSSSSSSSFLNPAYIEIYVPRSEYTPRVYVCIRIYTLQYYVLFRVRGPELEPPPPPESYSMWYGCDCMWARPDYPTANSYQRQRCVYMIYGLPARESRTDGRLHFHFFIIFLYKNTYYIHIWYIIISSDWVYKVLYNVIISAARANIIVVLIRCTLYTYIRHGTSVYWPIFARW